MPNLFDNKPHQPSNFKTENCVEINDDSCGTYKTNSQIKLKTTMLKTRLCDYSDAYIPVKEINNTQEDNTKYLDVEMLMYNLIEYSGNYLKTFGSLWQ